MEALIQTCQKVAKLLSLLPDSFAEFVRQVQTLDTYRRLDEEEELTDELDFDKVYAQAYRRAVLEESLGPKSVAGALVISPRRNQG